ncbi:MAG: MHYT domain-containing protein, partial [Acidobacteriota bacterium]
MEFWRFIGTESRLGPSLTGTYDLRLVALSVLVAVLAGVSALAVVDRVVMPRRRHRPGAAVWLIVGAAVMGSGVWAMHFTAMLSFVLPVSMSYRVDLTLLSVAPAILASGAALHVMSRPEMDWRRVQAGALMLAAGIGAMHFIGMEAMRLDAVLRYRFPLFVLSIVVAHLLATAALHVRLALRRSGYGNLGQRLVGATILGGAVSGMHYTAMAAARFYPVTHTRPPVAMMSPALMSGFIAAVVLMISSLTLVGTFLDRRLAEASDRTFDAAMRYQVMLGAMSNALVIIDGDGRIETFNAAAGTIFGLQERDMIGEPFDRLIAGAEGRVPALLHDHRGSGQTRITTADRGLRGRRAGGAEFPIELAISRMKLLDRELFACSIVDVSERGRLERQIEHTRNMETMCVMAAGVAGEVHPLLRTVGIQLRAAVTALKGPGMGSGSSTGVTLTGGAGIRPATLSRAHADLEKCLQQLDAATDRMRSMKTFFRARTHRSSLDLNDEVKCVTEVSRPVWSRTATLETDLDAELPAVPGVASDLRQVILNMILNAAEATARARTPGQEPGHRITIATRRQGDLAVLTIRDTVGDAPVQARVRVTERFFSTR